MNYKVWIKKQLYSITRLVVGIVFLAFAVIEIALAEPATPVEVVHQTGHNALVAALSPTGKYLVTAGGNTLKIWSLESKRLLHTELAGSTSFTQKSAISFSGDGRRAVLASSGGLLVVLTVPEGRRLYDAPFHTWGGVDAALNHDGSVAAIRTNNAIRILDVASGREIRTLSIPSVGLREGAASLAFNHQDQLVFASFPVNTEDKSPRVIRWDAATGKTLGSPAVIRSTGAKALSLGKNGSLLALTTSDGNVRLLELPTQRTLLQVQVLPSKFDDPPSVIFDGSGRRIAVVSGDAIDRLFQVFEVPDGRNIFTASLGIGDAADLGYAGNLVFVGSDVIDLDKNKPLFSIPKPKTGGIGNLVMSEIGNRFAWSRSFSVLSMDLKGSRINRLPIDCHAESLAMSATGDLLACRQTFDGELVFWDYTREVESERRKPGKGNLVVFDRDGKLLAIDVNGDEIEFWDPTQGSPIARLRIPPSPEDKYPRILAMQFGPTPNSLWVRTDRVIYHIDPEAIAIVSSITHKTSTPKPPFAITQDGSHVASAYVEEVMVWDGATGRIEWSAKSPLGGQVSAAAFSSDGKLLVTSSWGARYGTTVWDASTGDVLHTLSEHTWIVDSISFLPNSYLVITGGGGKISISDAAAGTLLSTMLTSDLGRDWIAVSPEGYFDGTRTSWQEVAFRLSSDPSAVHEPEKFFYNFFQPGLLGQIVSQQASIASILQQNGDPRIALDINSYRNSRQPDLRIVKTTHRNLPLGEEKANRVIKVSFEARDKGSGLQDLRVFRNGLLVHAERGTLNPRSPDGKYQLDVPVKLVEGKNEITAYVFNRDNIKSKDATIDVRGPWGFHNSTAYILSIGITKYANPEFDLRHADSDAQKISSELKSSFESRYREVVAVPLLNENATKKNILIAFARLAGSTEPLPLQAPSILKRLRAAEPEDSVIIFFSGHGAARNDRYYLIPHDLGYTGQLQNLRDKGRQALINYSISDRDLERRFEKIDTGRFMLIIDACQSGQVLESKDQRLGPMNYRGIAQLAYEKGIYVLAATQSYEAAVEFENQGNGLLTYVLLERGLKNRAADFSPRDGRITVGEWFDHAVETVPREFDAANAIYLERNGKSIDYSETGVTGQFPRAYYRLREKTIRWEKQPDPWILNIFTQSQ